MYLILFPNEVSMLELTQGPSNQIKLKFQVTDCVHDTVWQES